MRDDQGPLAKRRAVARNLAPAINQCPSSELNVNLAKRTPLTWRRPGIRLT
jgi:hypothetical protein